MNEAPSLESIDPRHTAVRTRKLLRPTRIAGLAYWWLGFASSAVLVTAWPADETSLPAPETVLQAATARLADSAANKNNFCMMENLR
jgi:hypothetical protein